VIGPSRILVVDDQETQIQILRDQLRDYDFEVDGMTDPLKVIDHLRNENDYALLIVDVNLGPRKDGITLASQIRSHLGKKTPILFVSADASKEARARIRRFSLDGGVSFLEKGSFNSEELFDNVVSLIRETDTDLKLDEVRGRQAGLKDEFSEVKQIILDFVTDRTKLKPVTLDDCNDRRDAVVKSATRTAIGVAVKEAGKKIDEALKPESLVEKIDMALKPELAFNKAKEAPAAKAYMWAFGVIFLGLLAWWSTTWIKADNADGRTTLLEEKHKQILNTMQVQTTQMRQIKYLLSHNGRRVTTGI